eukprot:24646_1
MDAAISTEVNDFAKTINKQNGLIDTFMKQLSVKKNKKIVQDTFVDVMINIVQSKIAFSDDMLNLAFRIVAGNKGSSVLASNLWKCIVKTAKSIIEAKTKNGRDWHWLKEYLLPSTIWLIDLDPSQPLHHEEGPKNDDEKEKEKKVRRKYLFYELLKVVKEKVDSQVNDIVLPMKKLIDESGSSWKELCEWNIVSSLENSEKGCRQDAVPNGTMPDYSKDELSRKA